MAIYVPSAQSTSEALNKEFARHELLVEKVEVNESDDFEAAVYCATALPSQVHHKEPKQNILLRHWSPMITGDLQNQIQYMWHVQQDNSRSLTLPQQGETKIHAATRSGDLDKVIDLVDAGESTDSFYANAWTPLHIATVRGSIDTLTYLFCQFPDKEILGKGMNEDTPLSFIVFHDQTESVGILLEFGANIHTRNQSECSPIMVATHERHVDVVKMLLEHSTNPNDKAGISGSALLLASGAGKRRLPILKALIRGGANVNLDMPMVSYTVELLRW